MRIIAALVWCPALLAVARPAECMQAPRLEPGTRIRLDASGVGGRLTGTVEEVSADTLMVRVDGDAPGLALLVPTDSVTRLEVQRDRRMTIEGAGLGVLAGTLLAVLASPDVVDENGNCTTAACLAYKVSPHVGTRIKVLSVAGALLGAIVGSTTKTMTWANVDLQRLDVSATGDGGLALGVRISF
ncbi:MAG TPA: hypothetical protein VKB45_03370 [Gemmatimonadales bacterium]|nr:hypothetical protein [Gemmatimonadales bacterium]